MPRLRLLFGVILAALLIAGAAGKSVWLCDTGEVCHACDGCGQIDPCGDEPKDCDECCSPAELRPAASLKKSGAAAIEVVWESPADLPKSFADNARIPPTREAFAPLPALFRRVADPPFTAQHGLRAPPYFS